MKMDVTVTTTSLKIDITFNAKRFPCVHCALCIYNGSMKIDYHIQKL